MLKGKAALEAMKYILNKDPPVNDITNLIGSVVIAVETIETFNDIIFVKKVITSIMVARPDITIKFGDNHAKPKRKKIIELFEDDENIEDISLSQYLSGDYIDG